MKKIRVSTFGTIKAYFHYFRKVHFNIGNMYIMDRSIKKLHLSSNRSFETPIVIR